MNRGLELEGQRFGHLTVLKRLDERENRYIMWLCRCDCGNEIKVNTRRLVRGTIDNCGCIPEKTARRGPVAEDLTGQRFGKLVAVRRIRSQNGRTRWECRCDCGNMHIVTAHALKAGKCTSCGCSRYEKGRGGTDISGQKFGRLTALYHTDKRSKKARYSGTVAVTVEMNWRSRKMAIFTAITKAAAACARKSGKNFRGSFIWLMEPAWKCWKRENTAVTIPAVFVESTI